MSLAVPTTHTITQFGEIALIGGIGLYGRCSVNQQSAQNKTVLISPNQFADIFAARPITTSRDLLINEALEMIWERNVHCAHPIPIDAMAKFGKVGIFALRGAETTNIELHRIFGHCHWLPRRVGQRAPNGSAFYFWLSDLSHPPILITFAYKVRLTALMGVEPKTSSTVLLTPAASPSTPRRPYLPRREAGRVRVHAAEPEAYSRRRATA